MTTHSATVRRFGAAALALTLSAAAVVLAGGTANAAIVPTVPLATAAQYAVIGGQTVTNTGPTTMNLSLGVYPGNTDPLFTGPPEGQINPPGVAHLGDAEALQAQSDSTAAYGNTAGRPITANTGADLGGLTLQGGVYAVDSNGAMGLTGPLVLDGAGNRNSVFIFKTDSSLTMATGSTVSLINGAQECNVFWQVGSSATLRTGSVFRGNILAQTSIFVEDSVSIHGRTLAQTGEVTLINDTFVAPTCQLTGAVPGFPPTTGGTTPPAATGTGTGTGTGTTGGGTATGLTNGVPGVSGPPRTGGAPLQRGSSFPWLAVLFFGTFVGVGTADVVLSRRARVRRLGLASTPMSTNH